MNEEVVSEISRALGRVEAKVDDVLVNQRRQDQINRLLYRRIRDVQTQSEKTATTVSWASLPFRLIGRLIGRKVGVTQ